MSNSKPPILSREDEPWKNKELVIDLYENQDHTYREMADMFGCAPGTVSTWMKKHNADEIRDGLDVDIPDEEPHKDKELMETLYVDEELSTSEISAVIKKSSGCVRDWLLKHGIEIRSVSEGVSIARGGRKDWYFYSNKVYGHETIKPNRNEAVLIHRLLAVAEYGFEAVKGKSVHHINGIPWDNRPDNIELMTRSDHHREHGGGFTDLDHLRAFEMYCEGNSSYTVADVIGCSPATVRHWIRDIDGDVLRGPGGGAT